MNETKKLIEKSKTFAHHDQRVEWLIWQLATSLEKALDRINKLESEGYKKNTQEL